MKIKNIASKVKKGTIIVEVEGFFVERFLNLCKSHNIEIHDIKYITAGLITFKTSSNKFVDIRKVANKTKCKAKIKKKKGIYFVLFRYKKRRIFFFFFLLIVLALITLSTFVLRINITGNSNVSNKEILDILKKADVYIGKNRLFIDERKAGNMLRTELYDIAWVGIDIKGTNVNVEVVEKTLMEEDENKNAVGNIISTKSGIITKIIAENGTAKLLTGSYIEKGMTAIEGIIESELIGNISVRASGILRVQSTHTYVIEEKYNVEEKLYSGKKKYGIGISINDKEFILKYLPKDHIYDINKKEKKIELFGTSFGFVFIEYPEYDLIKTERTFEELQDICKTKYEDHVKSILNETIKISNEKVNVLKQDDGIKYTVTYDLEEDAGEFLKTGEK